MKISRIFFLFLCVIFLLATFGCQMLTPLPDENKIKSDLIGKKLIVNDEEVWSFVALSEFNSFHIIETQKADRTAEFTVNSCFKNLEDNRKFFGEYVCAYKFDDSNKWILSNVFAKKFGEVDSSGRLFSSQSDKIPDAETEVDSQNYTMYPFEVTAEMQNAKVNGSFETADGSTDLAIFDGKFTKDLENRTTNNIKAIYDSGKMVSDNVDVSLKPGKYVLVIANPQASNIKVKSDITLDYDKVLGTNYECH